MRETQTVSVGLLGVGHDSYWTQFPGLRETLLGYQQVLAERLGACGVEVQDFSMVDDAESAAEVLPRLLAADIDVLFVDMLTYATSATWGRIIQGFSRPVVLVALQPLSGLDCERATMRMQLENDNICAVPEFMGVAERCGRRPPPLIVGTLYDDLQAEAELARWCRIARVLHDLRTARIGQMGHSLEAMLDMHHDPTMFTAHFGMHVVMCEADHLFAHSGAIDEADINRRSTEILDFFDTPEPGVDEVTSKLTDVDLRRAARGYACMERYIAERRLDGLAYYYEGAEGSELRDLMGSLIVGNSLLCAGGFPICSENDLKTCVAMMIFDRLGIGGSFAELHPIDFEDGIVLVGHDGPHHVGIVEGRPILRSLGLYHGKPGHGASVEFKIKEGPITMMSIGQTFDGRFRFVIAEGMSEPGPIPQNGNTNTRARFGSDIRTFLQRWLAAGPTHHFALGVGHHARSLVDIAHCLGIESMVIKGMK